MSSFRQIEANRRNARLSTGPVTEDGRRKSQQNALRHGLTAETVIDALEDAEDYGHSKWPRPPTMTHNQLSGENSCSDWRALVWRLRRATTIESGLFKIQATCCHFDNGNRLIRSRQETIDSVYRGHAAG